jgi:ABC-type glutathione transport system ATPase component
MSKLEAVGIAKRYRARQIVNDLSLALESGDVVGLLGPNGAGKTTAFYMIVGLVGCDRGNIVLNGRDVTRLPVHRRARLGLGYLPQEASVFRKLTVADNIRAILQVRKDLDRAARQSALEELMEELHISHVRDSLGRRAPQGRDRPRPCRGAQVRAARRAVCRRRSDIGARHPADHQALEPARHWRADYGSQCAGDTWNLRLRIYSEQRRAHGLRHAARDFV